MSMPDYRFLVIRNVLPGALLPFGHLVVSMDIPHIEFGSEKEASATSGRGLLPEETG